MGTNSNVPRAAPLVGVTSSAVQITRGGIVRCEDCFAEGALDEGLVDYDTESVVFRVRGYFV